MKVVEVVENVLMIERCLEVDDEKCVEIKYKGSSVLGGNQLDHW